MEAREWRDPRVLAVIVAMTGNALLGALATYFEATRAREPVHRPAATAPACAAPTNP